MSPLRTQEVSSSLSASIILSIPCISASTKFVTSERVMTSGHGGVFPPGLPVGLVGSVNDNDIKVRLFSNYNRIEFVRIADFGLRSLIDNKSLEYGVGGDASKEQ